MIETDGDCCGFMQFKYNYLERWIANKFRILYFMKLFLLHKISYCTEYSLSYKLKVEDKS